MVELALTSLDEVLLPHCYVALRVGESQKIGRLSAERTYTFPQSVVGEHRYGTLDVFQRVGGCTISINPKDGDQDVNLNTRTGKLCFRLAPAELGKADVKPNKVLENEPQRMTEAKAYLSQHNLEMRLKDAMQGIIDELPEDPVSFLTEKLLESEGIIRRAQSSGAGWKITARPQANTVGADVEAIRLKTQRLLLGASAQAKAVPSDTFRNADANNDGAISSDEFSSALQSGSLVNGYNARIADVARTLGESGPSLKNKWCAGMQHAQELQRFKTLVAKATKTSEVNPMARNDLAAVQEAQRWKAEAAKAQEKVLQLQAEMSALRASMASGSTSAVDETISQLQAEKVSQLQAEMSALRAGMASDSTNAANEVAKIRAAHAEEKQRMEGEVSRAFENAVQLQARLDETEKAHNLHAGEAAFKELQGATDKLQELDKLRAAHLQEKRTMQADIAKAYETADLLREDLNIFRAGIETSATKANNELEKLRDAHMEEKQRLGKEISKSAADVAKAVSGTSQLQSQLEEVQLRKAEAESQRQVVEENFFQAQVAAQTHRLQAEVHEQRCVALEIKFADTDSKLSDSFNTIRQLKTELDKVRLRETEFDAKLKAAEDQFYRSKVLEETERLEAEASGKPWTSEWEERAIALEQELAMSIATIAQLQTELDDVRLRRTDSDRQRKAAEEALERRCAAEAEITEKMQATVKQAQGRANELENELARLRLSNGPEAALQSQDADDTDSPQPAGGQELSAQQARMKDELRSYEEHRLFTDGQRARDEVCKLQAELDELRTTSRNCEAEFESRLAIERRLTSEHGARAQLAQNSEAADNSKKAAAKLAQASLAGALPQKLVAEPSEDSAKTAVAKLAQASVSGTLPQKLVPKQAAYEIEEQGEEIRAALKAAQEELATLREAIADQNAGREAYLGNVHQALVARRSQPKRMRPGERPRTPSSIDLVQANPLQQLHFRTIQELARERDEAFLRATTVENASDEEEKASEAKVETLQLALEKAFELFTSLELG